MIRVDGCKGVYERTFDIGKYIIEDMEDRSRWTVEASVVEVRGIPRKRIVISWRPRKSVYLYLKSHCDQFERHHPKDHFYPMKIRSRYYARPGTKGRIIPCSFIKWARKSEFVDGEIKATCLVVESGLEYGKVNMGHPSILTRQKIHITVECPCYDGIQHRMKSSDVWRDNHESESMKWIPFQRKWTMNCSVSSDNGVYLKNKAGDMIPLNVIADKHKDYHRIRAIKEGEPESQTEE